MSPLNKTICPAGPGQTQMFLFMNCAQGTNSDSRFVSYIRTIFEMLVIAHLELAVALHPEPDESNDILKPHIFKNQFKILASYPRLGPHVISSS